MNLSRCVRKKLPNFVKKRSNASYSEKEIVKRKISTRSARNRGGKTKKRRKSRKKRRLIDSESWNRFSSSKKWMSQIETLAEIWEVKRKKLRKLSANADVKRRRPKRLRMIVNVPTTGTNASVKIAKEQKKMLENEMKKNIEEKSTNFTNSRIEISVRQRKRSVQREKSRIGSEKHKKSTESALKMKPKAWRSIAKSL